MCVDYKGIPVIASTALLSSRVRHYCHREAPYCHREERSDLDFDRRQTAKRKIATQANSVIARNVAISPFCHRECDISVIASVTLLSSRGTWRSRPSVIASTILLSSRGTWRSRLSVIASATFLSSRGTWRSRLFRAGKQSKERLPRFARNDKTTSQARLSMSSRGTWRSRLFRAGKQLKERLLRFARNTQRVL